MVEEKAARLDFLWDSIQQKANIAITIFTMIDRLGVTVQSHPLLPSQNKISGMDIFGRYKI